jgi:acetyltransferase-like isoleucine patch superfamily enzyme
VRSIIKRLLFLLSVAAAFPLYVVYRVVALFGDEETAFQGPSQLVSLIPGRPGNHVRAGFYALSLRHCAPECSISFGTILSTPHCEVGRHVYIGAYCVISDSIIGDDALIGSHVHIVSGKHAHGFEASDVPMRLQPTARRAIRIGENSWIGNGAIVMADVGRGSIVGAGSVVVREVDDNSVVAGNPARVIRKRVEALNV